ncbi:MAG: hypothetical protein Q9179_006290 [Wetmoreana sp. 5 TL-2023]
MRQYGPDPTPGPQEPDRARPGFVNLPPDVENLEDDPNLVMPSIESGGDPMDALRAQRREYQLTERRLRHQLVGGDDEIARLNDGVQLLRNQVDYEYNLAQDEIERGQHWYRRFQEVDQQNRNITRVLNDVHRRNARLERQVRGQGGNSNEDAKFARRAMDLADRQQVEIRRQREENERLRRRLINQPSDDQDQQIEAQAQRMRAQTQQISGQAEEITRLRADVTQSQREANEMEQYIQLQDRRLAAQNAQIQRQAEQIQNLEQERRTGQHIARDQRRLTDHQERPIVHNPRHGLTEVRQIAALMARYDRAPPAGNAPAAVNAPPVVNAPQRRPPRPQPRRPQRPRQPTLSPAARRLPRACKNKVKSYKEPRG